MDRDNEQLQEETGLTEYVIYVIKEAKRNDFYKGPEWNDRSGSQRTSKFDKMTDKMEKWLRQESIDREKTWKDIKNQFNMKFNRAEIVPVSSVTIGRWGRKMSEAT